MLRKLILGFLFGFAALTPSYSAQTPREIVFRHALSGMDAEALGNLVDRYNEINKGSPIVLQNVSRVQDLRQLPHMALLEDDEYEKFFDGRPRMLPLYKVMIKAKEELNASSFYPVIADVVDDYKGRIKALPLAQSVPMLFYNKDELRKAGIDAEPPLQTWEEVQQIAGRLFDAGYTCPFTSSSPEWVHLENLATQHNDPLTRTEAAGKSRLVMNGMVEIKHIALLSSWYKSRYFHYFGRGREADSKFASGECAMLTSYSSFYKQLAHSRSFDVGVTALPHYADVYGVVPDRVLPDGPVIMIPAGKKEEEYRGVAHFIAFLLRPDIQQAWVRATGYLPMTPAALDAPIADDTSPGELRKVALRLLEKKLVTAARPKTAAGFGRVRVILNEELEEVWANRKPAKQALDDAMRRGNAAMRAAAPEGE